jgi:2-polyprenyl-3-methyl-5-hydroxy-6-metoxy-1,4-benzoquinol methylase
MSSALLSTATPKTQAASAVSDSCSLCEQPSQPVFKKHDIWIRECSSCQHRFALPEEIDNHVEQIYGDDYFFSGGAGYDNYLSESGLLVPHGQRYGRLLKRYGAGRSLLDVGSAAGLILQGLVNEGFDGCGVEPNETMARFALTELQLDVTASAFEDFEADRQFDVVTVVQVMGHFIDPVAAVQKLHKLVRPGGLCLVETWDAGSWPARVLGSNWHEYSPPSVLQWFSRGSLRQLFERCNFEQVANGRPSKWINAAHVRSLIDHKLPQASWANVIRSGLSRIPESLNLPYPSDDLFWALFRRI